MNRKILLFVLFIVFFNGSTLHGQTDDPSILTLERIFSSNEFTPERFGPARWLREGNGYTTLEPSNEVTGAQDLIRYDPETGRREIAVSARRLIPPGEKEPLTIDDYSWSSNDLHLLIYTNSKRVWRQNTRGDYWVLDLETMVLSQLGGDAASSTLMFATFSPDGEKICYVRENNLFIEDVTGNEIIQLTSDGSETVINGTFDWVYEEELSLRNGFRWSPDGKSIAYWQLDAEGVGEFFLINNTDSLYPRIIPIQYPKVGTTNSACRVGVVSAAGGTTRWMNMPGDPRNNYIARMDWATNSNEIVLQYLNRLQNTLQVMLGDVQTGTVSIVLTERDDAWIDVRDDLHWLNNGQHFTWVSERDGWRHIYLVSRSGNSVQLMTPGNFDVESIQNIDEENVLIYYIASPDNPTQRYLYRVPLDGSGKAERISPENQIGTHLYLISPRSDWSFHTYSSFDEPPVIELVQLPQHRVIRTLVDNAPLRKKMNNIKKQPTEFFRITVDTDVELDGWLMKPFDIDQTKRYPLFIYVYGETAGQTVLDRWAGSRYLWHQMLAQQGYIIVSVDNRGTPAPRGREWRKSVYRQIGILASEDQASAVRAIIKERPYVDATRIGIWGWSGGGSMSLNAIFRYPDLYHTAMAIAPVSNQRFYDTIYQERYMGLPEDNPEGFKYGSPITFAHQLEGNLLVVHGTGDDNVHYQNAEALINELISHNKKFTMMSYPNRTHGIREGRNTTRHLFELLTRYLHENLPAGPR